jgi:hypothetical protein
MYPILKFILYRKDIFYLHSLLFQYDALLLNLFYYSLSSLYFVALFFQYSCQAQMLLSLTLKFEDAL